MKKFISFLLIANSVMFCSAQNIGIGTNSPNSSAMLDVSSTTKGLLIPRMTSAQRTSIASPANGLIVYDITTSSFWFYNGSAWTNLTAGGNSFILPYSNTVAVMTTAFKIKNDEPAYTAIEGESATGIGVSGKSVDGAGVSGTSVTQNGVYGYSATGNGVYAKSGIGPGLYAFSGDGVGISATSNNNSAISASINNLSPAIIGSNINNGVGVKGVSNTYSGVEGVSTSGNGVYGMSGSGYGIIATSTNNSSIYAYSSNDKPTINAYNGNALGVAIKGASSLSNGILGTSESTAKAGIRGEATGLGGYGVYGTSSSSQGYGVYGNNMTGIGVYGFSNTGTGVKALSNSGLALDVNGNLKIAGGNTNPVNGAILRSDASGNAVWQKTKVAFRAKGINSSYTGMAYNTFTRVHWASEEHDYDNNYALHVGSNPGPNSSVFVVPVSGLYHFDVSISFSSADDSPVIAGSLDFNIIRGGNLSTHSRKEAIQDHGSPQIARVTLATDVKLLAGDIVFIEALINTDTGAGGILGTSSNSNFFNGHLVFAD